MTVAEFVFGVFGFSLGVSLTWIAIGCRTWPEDDGQ